MPAPLHTETRAGDAPALVFVHAFGASSRTWRGVVDALGGGRVWALPARYASAAPAAGQA